MADIEDEICQFEMFVTGKYKSAHWRHFIGRYRMWPPSILKNGLAKNIQNLNSTLIMLTINFKSLILVYNLQSMKFF